MRTLADERRAAIVSRLEREGRVLAADLVIDLDVSRDTVRRDLEELEAAGLLRRVHGGALPPAIGDRPYRVRREQATAAKAAIGEAAARLIRPGSVVFLDAGTTALAVARALPPDLEATIVTNSPPAASVLAEHPKVETVMLGGHLLPEALATIGAATLAAIEQINADIHILGVCSLHPELGISVLELEESHVKRAMIARAAEVVAVTSAEKIGSAAPYVVGPLDELTRIVTDASPEQLAPFRATGIDIVRV